MQPFSLARLRGLRVLLASLLALLVARLFLLRSEELYLGRSYNLMQVLVVTVAVITATVAVVCHLEHRNRTILERFPG